MVVTILVRLMGPEFHQTVPQPRKHAYELRLKRLETNRTLARLRRSKKPTTDVTE